MAKTLEAHDKLIREIVEHSYVRGKYRDEICATAVRFGAGADQAGGAECATIAQDSTRSTGGTLRDFD